MPIVHCLYIELIDGAPCMSIIVILNFFLLPRVSRCHNKPTKIFLWHYRLKINFKCSCTLVHKRWPHSFYSTLFHSLLIRQIYFERKTDYVVKFVPLDVFLNICLALSTYLHTTHMYAYKLLSSPYTYAHTYSHMFVWMRNLFF